MEMVWEWLKAALLGVVQGITEWLPISSTGHLLLINEFLNLTVSTDPVHNAAFLDVFKVVIQLGSILAVLVLYFHRLNPFSRKKSVTQRRSTWSLWMKVLVATIPTVLLGLPLDDIVDEYLSIPAVIAAALIVYGILFIWMEYRKRTPRIRKIGEMKWQDALAIGAFQALAIIPGTSRSGATIFGATLLGCSRQSAAEFSFFMAIPVMFGASALKLLKFVLIEKMSFSATEWIVLLIGTVVAFAVSVLVIRLLMNFIKKHDFKAFGWYRIALGLLVLLYFVVLGQ